MSIDNKSADRVQGPEITQQAAETAIPASILSAQEIMKELGVTLEELQKLGSAIVRSDRENEKAFDLNYFQG